MMKQVKDYKYLPLICKNITKIQTNGLILKDIMFDSFSMNTVSGIDDRNSLHRLDKKTFLKAFVIKINNHQKRFILSDKQNNKDIDDYDKFVHCPTKHNKFNIAYYNNMPLDFMERFKYLYCANFITETFTREYQYDDLIFDSSNFISRNVDVQCPNSIKRYFLDKNNRDKQIISLNKIYIPNLNVVKDLFDYDKNYNILISKNNDTVKDNLFYLKLIEAFSTYHDIEIFKISDDRIIKESL